MSDSWLRLVDRLIQSNILKSSQVIRAMIDVPRYLFLSERDRSYATIDTPLPIGDGQTVSAPLR